MTENHPITPPPELLRQWRNEGYGLPGTISSEYVAARAAQWGADAELEACRQWLEINGAPCKFIDGLLVARRPKPPSEKQQALEDLDALQADLANYGMGFKTTNIRRALESIPDPS